MSANESEAVQSARDDVRDAEADYEEATFALDAATQEERRAERALERTRSKLAALLAKETP